MRPHYRRRTVLRQCNQATPARPSTGSQSVDGSGTDVTGASMMKSPPMRGCIAFGPSNAEVTSSVYNGSPLRKVPSACQPPMNSSRKSSVIADVIRVWKTPYE